MAYHNADLSWEERNLVEDYLQAGEIKLLCAKGIDIKTYLYFKVENIFKTIPGRGLMLNIEEEELKLA